MMPSVKKLAKIENNSKDDQNQKVSSDEHFHKILKVFQKVSQETKRQVKMHEFYLSRRHKKLNKRSNAAKKNKKRS